MTDRGDPLIATVGLASTVGSEGGGARLGSVGTGAGDPVSAVILSGCVLQEGIAVGLLFNKLL